MTLTVAELLLILCAGNVCYAHGSVVQVPVPAPIVSYTRGPEMMPKGRHEGVTYVLVPEFAL